MQLSSTYPSRPGHPNRCTVPSVHLYLIVRCPECAHLCVAPHVVITWSSQTSHPHIAILCEPQILIVKCSWNKWLWGSLSSHSYLLRYNMGYFWNRVHKIPFSGPRLLGWKEGSTLELPNNATEPQHLWYLTSKTCAGDTNFPWVILKLLFKCRNHSLVPLSQC